MTPKQALKLISTAALLAILAVLYVIFESAPAGLPESQQQAAVETASSTTPTASGDLVIRTVDGDTLKVLRGGTEDTVRLIGVDTPESVDPRQEVQCFGKEAAQKTKDLVQGKVVRLELDATQGERDRYGRLLAYVHLPDGTFLNDFLIRQGYAYEYTYRSAYTYQAQFKSAQVDAENYSRGLWAPETCGGNK